tara:strand:+ start:863 stop:1708 length:846 start_codon:yes stop_codon:yes gene_type:complete
MKKKLTKNQFQKMVREEISNLVTETYGEIGKFIPAYQQNDATMGRISENERKHYWIEDYIPTGECGTEIQEKWIDKLADMLTNEMITVETMRILMAVRKKLGRGEELTEEDIWAIEDSNPVDRGENEDPIEGGIDALADFADGRFDEAKITKSVLRKMLEEEYQNVMEAGGEKWPKIAMNKALRSSARLKAAEDSDDDEFHISDEEYGPSRFAEVIADLENMHTNLEGIIAVIDEAAGPNEPTRALTGLRAILDGIIGDIKELPNAPLGNAIAMAGWDPES